MPDRLKVTPKHPNAYYPDSLTLYDLLATIPDHVRNLSSIVVVLDQEELGPAQLTVVSFDPETRALIVGRG